MILKQVCKKCLSLVCAAAILIGSITAGAVPAYAAAASDIPSNMLNSYMLDALQYLGYDVQALINDGKIYQSGYYASGGYGTGQNLTKSKYWSGIGYDSAYVVTGLETANGQPNLTRFKTYGLCCASFVSFYFFNYLPNVKNVPFSNGDPLYTFYTYVKNSGYGFQSAGSMGHGLVNMAAAGLATQVATANNYSNLKEGDIVTWYSTAGTGFGHVAIYLGYYNGQHFIAHVGNYRGPEISSIATMDKYGGMAFRAGYRINNPPPVRDRGAIVINKKASDTGAALSGATFKLYSFSGIELKSGTTGSGGQISFDDLDLGTYIVKETGFPSGYESSGTTSWTVTINNSCPKVGVTYTYTLGVTNKRSVGTIGVKKNDSNGSPLANVVFGVYSDNTCKTLIGKMTTNSNGIATLGDLIPKTYYVKEISTASNAYILNQTVYSAAVKSNMTTYINSGNAVVNQLKKWKLTVTKKDATADTAQGDATLQGAVYGLYNSSGTLLKQYTTDVKGQFTTDAYAADTGYYLQEISPSTGYQLNTAKVALDNYTSPAKLTAALTTSAVSVPESVIVGKILIKKYTLDEFSNSREPESGAVFRYYLKSAGSYDASSVYGEITTDEDGIATTPDIPYGTYVIHQKSGAVGTDMIEDFEVTIDENGKTYTYEKDDPLWMATLNIEKHEAGSMTPLIAEFTLYDSETDAALETKSTDTSGKLAFDTKLIYGKSYYALESSVDGFEANTTKYEFSCTEKDQVITKVIENIPAEASITIRKTSSIGTPIKDVVFLLEYSVDDGTSWSSIQKRSNSDPVQAGYCDSADLTADGTLSTDENGFVCFTGLRQDTQTGDILYRVTEVKTANGNTLLSDSVWTGHLPTEIGGQSIVNLEITVVNNPAFELPKVGGCGMIRTSIGASLFTLALFTLVILGFNRKKTVRNKSN